VHGGLEAVAAVVARTAGDPDALRVRRQRQRQPRDCEPGPFHEGVGWQRGGGSVLDPSRGGDVVQLPGAVGCDPLHGAIVIPDAIPASMDCGPGPQ
jgi:hypothetical protein